MKKDKKRDKTKPTESQIDNIIRQFYKILELHFKDEYNVEFEVIKKEQ